MTALPDPCTPTLSADGYDRVTKNFYDAAGQQRAVCAAVGTPLQLHTQYAYTPNGKPWFIVDANQNLTELDYDELDRLAATYFPVKLTASRSASSTDHEAYDYDANDNLNWFRKRDGSVSTYQYNKLNLPKVKQVPGRSGLSPAHSRSVFYTYDLRGFPEKALFGSATGQGIEQEYDALGRPKFSKYTLDGTNRTLTYEPNAKLRTAVTHSDSQRFAYDYDFAEVWYRDQRRGQWRVLPSSVHARIHTDAYYETVHRALSQATTRQEALQVLDPIWRSLF